MCGQVSFRSIFLILLLLPGSKLSGQPVLATAHIQNAGVGTAAILNSITMTIGYETNIYLLQTEYPLFEQYAITLNDVGHTFTANAQNDPDFAGFVQRLTDGISEPIKVVDSIGSTSGTPESQFFSTHPAGWNGIDLQGFQIGSITMHVDSLTINSPGSDPNHNGNWTDVFFQGTLTVFGVPEPSSAALLLPAMAFLIWKRRKFSRLIFN